MNALTFETCSAVNSEIIKRVTSSWSIFIELSVWTLTEPKETPFLHTIATSQYNIFTLFIFSCTLFLVLVQNHILPPPAPTLQVPSSFNSPNNRPICTKRRMDVVPQWTVYRCRRLRPVRYFDTAAIYIIVLKSRIIEIVENTQKNICVHCKTTTWPQCDFLLLPVGLGRQTHHNSQARQTYCDDAGCVRPFVCVMLVYWMWLGVAADPAVPHSHPTWPTEHTILFWRQMSDCSTYCIPSFGWLPCDCRNTVCSILIGGVFWVIPLRL